MSGKLIDERVVAVQPSLIKAFGSAAIVLQQVHFHSQGPHQYEHDGVRWWRVDPEEYGDETGLSEHQIRRAIRKLEEAGVLDSTSPGGYDRTKYHRIVRDHPLLVDNAADQAVCNSANCKQEHADSHALLTKTSGYLESDPASIQAAIDACEQCDKNGLFIPDVDDRHAPARKCDHRVGALVGGQPVKETA